MRSSVPGEAEGRTGAWRAGPEGDHWAAQWLGQGRMRALDGQVVGDASPIRVVTADRYSLASATPVAEDESADALPPRRIPPCTLAPSPPRSS